MCFKATLAAVVLGARNLKAALQNTQSWEDADIRRVAVCISRQTAEARVSRALAASYKGVLTARKETYACYGGCGYKDASGG